MGQVIDLWASEIMDTLRRSGSMVRATENVDVERWRRAARQAGRALGQPVRTGVTADGSTVWAAVLNAPPAAGAAAARAIGSSLYGVPSP